MGGLYEDYVFLLRGSLRTCSSCLPVGVWVGGCVCIRAPEHPRAPLHAACLLNVTHAASPFKPASSPNPAPCILKNSLTSVRRPSFNVISSECSVRVFYQK